jgi:hypothetical protein
LKDFGSDFYVDIVYFGSIPKEENGHNKSNRKVKDAVNQKLLANFFTNMNFLNNNEKTNSKKLQRINENNH